MTDAEKRAQQDADELRVLLQELRDEQGQTLLSGKEIEQAICLAVAGRL